MSQERKFNPYFNPDLIRSIEQDRLKETQKNQRSGFINGRFGEAIEMAEKLNIPVSITIGGRIIVVQKGVEVNQIDSQPVGQEPNGQK